MPESVASGHGATLAQEKQRRVRSLGSRRRPARLLCSIAEACCRECRWPKEIRKAGVFLQVQEFPVVEDSGRGHQAGAVEWHGAVVRNKEIRRTVERREDLYD